jgi:hypothetical protein
MIRTFLVLDAQTVAYVKADSNYLRRLGYELGFHKVLGRDVVVIDQATDETPSSLRGVAGFDYFVIEQYNAPYRRQISDGPYEELFEEGYIKACVVTEERGRRLVQSYVVEGRFLSGVYSWFNALVEGEKNDRCLHPAKPITEPPLSLVDAVNRAREIVDYRLKHGIVATKPEEFLDDFEQLYAELFGRERFELPKQTRPAGVDRDRVAAKLRLVLNVVRAIHGTDVPLYHAVTDLRDVLGFTDTSL